MSLENLFGSGFRAKNVQPGNESGRGICPHYQLIEICAEFAGITSEELASKPRFCGYNIKHEDSIGFLSGFRGEHYYPETTCTKIRDTLLKMLDEVNIETKEFVDSNLENIKAEKDLKKKQTLMKEELKQIEGFNRKQEILDTWRLKVYELTCVPPESKQDIEPHFKVTTMEELTEEQIIETVQKFLTALQNNVTGENEWRKGIFRLWPGYAEHCRQSPDHYQTGEYS